MLYVAPEDFSIQRFHTVLVHVPVGICQKDSYHLYSYSVVHEPARVSWHPALGGSNRGRRADSSPLATRAGSDRGPRADSTLNSSLLAVSWRFLGGFLEARAGSSRLESRSGLGSSLESRGAMRRAGSSLGLDSARAGS